MEAEKDRERVETWVPTPWMVMNILYAIVQFFTNC